ncbi:hat family dimerization domaincontaining protein-related [Holotrichia oblita]|uniref:Hat family dimerization domaincontaining protein-related n=1 Tax=Holotrichia oblita TaxID=644536 RepID=A0ACB9SLT8_HOLOL|nr:hat family dimerization domaincontaining protein-related [Holotrichia oblita]
MSSHRKRKSILDVSSRHMRRLISNNNEPKIRIKNQLPQKTQENKHNLGSDVSTPNPDRIDFTENYAIAYSSSYNKSLFCLPQNNLNVLNTTNYSNNDADMSDFIENCATECSNSNNKSPFCELHNDLNVCNTTNHSNNYLISGGEKYEKNSSPSLLGDLRNWAIKYNIKRRAVSGLLTVLRKHEHKDDLPKDYRTLLKTPRTTLIKSVPPGNCYHFDIKSQIVQVLNLEYKTFKFEEIRLKIGIDGLPISDSSSSQLWPILGCIHPSPRIFLIGVYHGYSKPEDSNQFLESFVEDINQLINEGLVFEESYDLALPKLKLAEIQSDLNSDNEETHRESRKIRKRILLSSSDEETETDDVHIHFPKAPGKKRLTHDTVQSQNLDNCRDNCLTPKSVQSLSMSSASTSTIKGGMFQKERDCCTCCCQFDKEYKRRTENDLKEVKNQLKLVLQVLREQNRPQPILNNHDDEISSIEYFNEHLPVKSIDDLHAWETKLSSKDEQKKMTIFEKKLENLLALATDGASVLCGSRNSVFTILKAAVPKLISVKCIAHSLHLCCSKAASVLPDELDFLCKHIYNWFARSHQRRECYIEVFETININEKNIKFNKFIQLSETRWLERANVIKVILQQWLEIKTYFTQVANTTKDTMGKVILGMLTDINFVYFTIIYNILVQVNIVNAAFQQTNGDAFQLYKELYQLLLTFLGIVIRPIFLENLTELKSSCVNKICEILQNELSYIQINIIDFGYNYRQAIVNNNLKLTDIEKIKQNSQHFVLTLCRELTKRIPQNLEVFYSIKYFSPEICLKQINRPKFDNLPLNILDDNLSKQDFENEWNNLLAVNWNLEKDISSHNFWVKVLEYQNAGGVHIYANIAKFALTTLTLPISNAFVERIFSFMNTIKTKFRNKINIPLLEALLRIKTEFVINDTCCHKFVPSKAMFQKFNATMYNFKKQAEGDVNDELVDIFSETEF